MSTDDKGYVEIIIEKFRGILDEQDMYQLEVKLTEIVGQYRSEELLDVLTLKYNKMIIEATPEIIPMAFLSYYGLVIKYRVDRDVIQLEQLIKEYHPIFEMANHKVEVLRHIKLLWILENTQFIKMDEEEVDKVFVEAEKAIEEDQKHAGNQHLYADLFATLTESGNPVDAELYFRLAIVHINVAIALNPKYAKYYNTKARILAYRGQFEEAYELVEKAIAIEDSSNQRYMIKIMYYNMTKARIQAQEFKLISEEQMRIMEENLHAEATEINKNFQKDTEVMAEKLREDIEKSSVSSIEIIGFFAGIISFFISSIQLVGVASSVGEAASLITILMGCCIVAYAAFSVVFHQLKKEYIIKSLIVAGLGLAIMVGGRFIGL